MNRLTTSRVRAFRRCPREHQLRYGLRYEPVTTAHFTRFGTLFHVGREHWLRAAAAKLPVAEWFDAGRAAMVEKWRSDDDPDEFEIAKALPLLLGYHERWHDEPMEVLAVEAEFTAPLINPDSGRASRTWELAGAIDSVVLVLVYATEEVWFTELKTTSLDISPGSEYWERLLVDDQVSNYHVGATVLGYDVVGCRYDVVKRPGQHPLEATPEENRKLTKGKGCKLCGGKVGVQGTGTIGDASCNACIATGWAEEPRLYSGQRDRDETASEYSQRIAEAIAAAPDDYYRRQDVVRFSSEIHEAQRDMWSAGKEIRAAQQARYHPRNPNSCVRFGNGRCSFFPVCSGRASLTDPTLYRIRETELPELNDPPTKEKSNGTGSEGTINI